MKVISSYKVKINKTGFDKTAIRDTATLYRNAVTFFISLIEKEWSYISSSDDRNIKVIEKLSHTTKDNPSPKYDFDNYLYKFPSYLRRAAINEAYGLVSSHHTRLDLYNKSNRKGIDKTPRLQYKHNSMPKFYVSAGGIFKWTGENTCKIKVYKNNDWVWINLNLRPSDVRYIRNAGKVLSPTIQIKKDKFYFVFPVESEVMLAEKVDKVVGIDLGLNSLATLCVMDDRGTIYKRKFVKNNKETDLLNHLLNKKKKLQRNRKSTKSIYREINNCQGRLEIYTCKEIIKFALDNNATAIVFEHLSPYMKAKGSYKEKIHLWRKKGIANRLSHMAHLYGLRYSTVCAKNTSKLAFDGSGEVVRGRAAGFKNNKMCKFSNGKEYNCDLSASYNIAARYFIREKIKPFEDKETQRLELEAKCPLAFNGTNNVYSTLISLNVVLEA